MEGGIEALDTCGITTRQRKARSYTALSMSIRIVDTGGVRGFYAV